MSPRKLTATLTIVTALIWGCWILSTGLTNNLALAGWMPRLTTDSATSGLGLAPLLPAGLFLGLVALAWINESRVVAYGIPLFPITGVILFFVRFMHGLSSFGAI